MGAAAAIELPGAGNPVRHRSVLPGFGPALGFAGAYLGLLVIIPLSTLFFRASGLGWTGLWNTVTTPRALAALRLSFGASAAGALIDVVAGLLIAWVLVRYRFPGRRLMDAIVDLPFALPTAVAGIALTTLYVDNGWVGRYLAPLGIKVAFTPLGIALALAFIGLPFVVRTVQPVLEDLEAEVEEAAASLGANRRHTLVRVIAPAVFPAAITGFTQAFARGVGEYGSVIFIAGNMPGKTEIVPLLIMTKLEQFDYAGASGLAVVMLVSSFLLLVMINLMQARVTRRIRGAH